MNIPEAVQLYTAMTLTNPYAKARTPEETDAIAEQISATLPLTPLPWAMTFVAEQVRLGSYPSLPDIASAWRAHAQRLIDSVPIPAAPPGVEEDPARWQQWESARRRALLQGSSPEQAEVAASRKIGAPVTPRQIAPSRPTEQSQAARDEVMERVRAWARQQAEEAAAIERAAWGGDNQ